MVSLRFYGFFRGIDRDCGLCRTLGQVQSFSRSSTSNLTYCFVLVWGCEWDGIDIFWEFTFGRTLESGKITWKLEFLITSCVCFLWLGLPSRLDTALPGIVSPSSSSLILKRKIIEIKEEKEEETLTDSNPHRSPRPRDGLPPFPWPRFRCRCRSLRYCGALLPAHGVVYPRLRPCASGAVWLRQW